MPTFPQINLNGTDGEELVALNSIVIEHLNRVQRAMANAYPHGRDYQTVIDPNAFNIARKEADERGIIIRQLIKVYEEIAEELQEQLEDRRARQR